MADEAPPTLRVEQALVRAQVAQLVSASLLPRDLPNLARVLRDAVGAEPERAQKVLDRLSLTVRRGERCVLLGEEGCGKTTLARVCARLVRLDGGVVAVSGIDVGARRRRDRLALRRRLQVIFDDPEQGLDPRRTIIDSLREAFDALRLKDEGIAFEERAARAMARAQLPPSAAGARARELSAGVRARAGLARALLSDPELLVIDEPTARLDPLERAALLDALLRLSPGPTEAPGPALLILTQRPDVARALAGRVGVLYLGTLVEEGGPEILQDPCHPYTRGFLAAAPQRSRPASARALRGELPSLAERPAGCPFHPRCPDAVARCTSERPPLVGGERRTACHVQNPPA